jgi:signal transduction histidine kinase
VKITIRDQGKGFDPDVEGLGFELSPSVTRHLAEVNGNMEVWSKPGRGTRVTLSVTMS